MSGPELHTFQEVVENTRFKFLKDFVRQKPYDIWQGFSQVNIQ